MIPNPIISVALATYNGAPYLREQLDSIYTPCGVTYEVVAADDGSTDGTRDILRDYARRCGLRDVTDGRHRGLTGNFGHVLQHCRGSYIALSDQDDIWTDGRLDRLQQEIGEYDAVYSLINRVLRPDGVIGEWQPPVGICDYAQRYGAGRPTAHLMASNWVISHTLFLRRRVLEAALPIPTTQPFHDGWLAVAASSGAGVRYLNPSLTIYREHAASLTAEKAAPPTRKFFGRGAGLARDSWRAKCEAEIARLKSCESASFVPVADRAFAGRLRRHFERGLRGGVSFRAGFEARRLAPYFYWSLAPRLRRNFVLRGFFGGL